MHSNNIVNFQESTTILNAYTKKPGSIVNFQESTTILNAYTKKPGNLLNAPRMIMQFYFWLQSCAVEFGDK